MRVFDRSWRTASVLTSAIAIAIAAIVLGIADGLWLVVAGGGFLLWILVVLAAIGIAAVNESLREYEREAMVDPVTELPNLDKLVADLDVALAAPGERLVLSVYLLDGLGSYTDAYGRACGDVLISWLARKLERAVAHDGSVYRMRGGEFAVLACGDERGTGDVRANACSALIELGEGFYIRASVGEVVLGD